MMTHRDLADRAIEDQASLADASPFNPWWGEVMGNMIKDPQNDVEASCSFLAHLATEARTVAVSPDMTDLVELAANQLMDEWSQPDAATEVLLPHDVPFTSGFARFDRPIMLNGDFTLDGVSYAIPVTGYAWHAGDGGVAFFPLSSRDGWLMVDGIAEQIGDAEGRRGRMPRVIAHDNAGWFFNSPWKVNHELAPGTAAALIQGGEARELNPAAASDRIILFALFRLMSEKIQREVAVIPSRPTRKRVGGKVPDANEVCCVTLRREGSEGEPSETSGSVEWSHRWMVDPGWQRRRVAVRDDEGNIIGSTRGVEGEDWIYRRVYIAPFVKGPADKPLVLRPKAAVLTR